MINAALAQRHCEVFGHLRGERTHKLRVISLALYILDPKKEKKAQNPFCAKEVSKE